MVFSWLSSPVPDIFGCFICASYLELPSEDIEEMAETSVKFLPECTPACCHCELCHRTSSGPLYCAKHILSLYVMLPLLKDVNDTGNT